MILGVYFKVLDQGYEHGLQTHKKVIGCDYEDAAAADNGDVMVMVVAMMMMMMMMMIDYA